MQLADSGSVGLLTLLAIPGGSCAVRRRSAVLNAGIAGSNPIKGTDARLLSLLCVV